MRASLAILAVSLSIGCGMHAEAADSRIDQISTTKAIKIAYRTDATPFSFVKDNEPVGYTIDICKIIVASLERRLNIQGLKIEWVPVTTQTRLDAIAKGTADMECGSSTVSLGRMQQVDFSSFVFVQTTGLVTKTSSGITRAADLVGKKVAVISGTTNEQALNRINQGGQLKVTVLPVKDRAEGISILESGGADAFAGDKILLAGAQYQNPQGLVMLPDDLSIEPYAIVLPLGDWKFRLAVNTGLADMYRRGAIVPIYQKWFSSVGMEPGVLLETLYVLGALPE
ncbi:MAG TPA: amino acid ABC transporter substrate-binding protein [Xanthobacteraceae bacterium]|jgi:glutamate/aspartate transport system substrate-binding protein